VTVSNAINTAIATSSPTTVVLGPLPTITTISTLSGSTAGGTIETITGTNFTGSTGVTFGGTSGTSFSVSSATQIVVTTPSSGSAGSVNVVVLNSNGNATLTSGFTYVAPPTLSGVAITGTATQGQILTAAIQGAGGGAATSTTYQWSRSSTSNGSFTSISGATNSTYTLTAADVGNYINATITVSNLAGSNNASSATPVGAIANISPTITSATISGIASLGQTLSAGTTGLGGGFITSTGYQWRSSYDGITYSDIGGATSSTFVITSSEVNKYIKVVVTVSNNSGSNSATSVATTKILTTVPIITSITPAIGTTAGGTSITLVGTGFFSGETVTIGGALATISSATSTQIVAVTPAGTAGATNVVVTNPDSGTFTSTSGFTYLTPVGISTTSIAGTARQGQVLTAGTTGVVGTSSTTSYQWLNSSDGISFTNVATGGTAYSYTVQSTDLGKYLEVQVTVSNAIGSASATSAPTSIVLAPLASITSIAITSGTTAGGTVLTITGTNFTSSTGVTFGGVAGTSFSVNSATQISITTPAHAAGVVDLVVLNPSGNATSTGAFTYQVPPSLASATFNGSIVVGQTLVATAGSVGGTSTSTTYEWLKSATSSGTYVSIASPSASNSFTLTSNELGYFIEVRIVVTNLLGNATRTSVASGQPVISASSSPSISSITKNAGTSAGGTSVTIAGANLSTVTAVTFDGISATISSKNATQIVVVTPAHIAGAVNVVATSPSGSFTSANGFTFVTPPSIRSWTTTPSITTGNVGDPFSVTYTAVCITPQMYGPSMYDLIYINPGSWTYNTYMGSGTSTDGGYTWTITKNYTLSSVGSWKIDAYERGACWDSYNFTYAARNYINVGVSAPTITSLSVTSGPLGGGTTTVVTGTNLSGITGITVGGISATSISSNTATNVTFNTPAGTAGAKDVVITSPSGTGTKSGGFTYLAPVVISYNSNGADSGTPSRSSDSYTPSTGGFSLPVVGTMVKAGYSFSGWATTSNSSSALTSPYDPSTTQSLFAIWSANSYKTSFNANAATSGAVPTFVTNAFGATVTVPGNSGSLVKSGFTLSGWNTAPDGTGLAYPLGTGTFVQGAVDQILYANWTANTYAISYNVNGTSDPVPATQSGKLAGSSVVLANAVTKAGSAFVGWVNNSITYQAGSPYTVGSSDSILVAKWVPVYTLSYNLNGTGASGTLPVDTTYLNGDSVTVTSSSPTRAGYTFAGWRDQSGGSHAAGTSFNISGTNYLLYAVWTAVPYSITYLLNGGVGTAPLENSKYINDSFTVAAAASKVGSTFAGWSDGVNIYGGGSAYSVGSSNVVLTAQWSAINYLITYDLAGGTSTVPAAVSNVFQTVWSLPAEPTRVGYTFRDWFDGTNSYVAGANYTLGIAANQTITARWNPIVKYQITYNLDGGFGDAPTQAPLQNGQSFTLPSSPSKTGFAFTGWNFGGATYTSGSSIIMPSQDVLITAGWVTSVAGTYAITYIGNGAQSSVPSDPSLAAGSTLTVHDGLNMVKNGYTFSGWSYLGSTYLGGETLTMTAAPVTFSAIWVPSVRATSVTQSVDSASITKGRSITVTYSLGCYNYSSTTPTLIEKVISSGESFINDITAQLTVVDAGYNWTVTRVYTLSYAGNYTVMATASGSCFVNPTDSAVNNVTVTEPVVVVPSGQSNANVDNRRDNVSGSQYGDETGVTSIPPVTVVGTRTALVANKFFTLPKLAANLSFSVSASAGSTQSIPRVVNNEIVQTTTLRVDSSLKGVSEVKSVDDQLAVVPTAGFSGKTSVIVSITDGNTTTKIEVPVTVLPVPVKDPILTPKSVNSSLIAWGASPNASGYQVLVDGKTVCKTSGDSCTVGKILGPNAQVEVIANGGDSTKSDVVDANYKANNPVPVVRIAAAYKNSILNSNDINNLNKVISTVTTQGFANVQITTISTVKRTQAAAKERLDAMVSYLKSKVTNPDFVVSVVPSKNRTALTTISVK